MSTFTLAGHELQFSDCREIGQAGPPTCTLAIDGEPVLRRFLWGSAKPLRFHQSPLEHNGDILVPLYEMSLPAGASKAARILWGRQPGFCLVRIDPRTLMLQRLSDGFGFMRLLRIVGDEAEFSTWWDDREKHTVKLT